ncbi:homocysteine S-methyltransferase family protein [Allorhizocola rhizosphaerae]|uniref:homocysteine S-methyltransferase family protein n=1 Tax=Allorhizocola rhizosphaerae TaxID=1872709 RepID=UPI000E3B9333|nr:homocysteine S-methyltransferase family protein [Allorhizocola rhizosphaerae]
MTRYGHELPQLGSGVFLTDGGVETDLIFNRGAKLPEFAAFPLLSTDKGRRLLDAYYREYIAVAQRAGTGFVLESATWRASLDWATRLGYDADALAHANRQAIEMLTALRAEFEAHVAPIVVSGCVGPRGDGYAPEQLMSLDAARDYHSAQISTFAETEADLVTAMTMGYVEEAAGVALAARDAGMPVVVAFTVETDGRLPVHTALGDAISAVDELTDGYPAYYMINCAHPSHFRKTLDPDAGWAERIRGLRANASRMSHAELDNSPFLDAGDPTEFGELHGQLRADFGRLSVLGGCCGTDVRHIRAIAAHL